MNGFIQALGEAVVASGLLLISFAVVSVCYVLTVEEE